MKIFLKTRRDRNFFPTKLYNEYFNKPLGIGDFIQMTFDYFCHGLLKEHYETKEELTVEKCKRIIKGCYGYMIEIETRN